MLVPNSTCLSLFPSQSPPASSNLCYETLDCEVSYTSSLIIQCQTSSFSKLVTRRLVMKCLTRWWFGTSDVVVYLSACEFVGNLQVQTSCLTCQCWWRSFSWLYQSLMWVSQNVSQAQLQVCHSPCSICYVEYPHSRVGYQCHWSHRYIVHARANKNRRWSKSM